MDEQTQEKFLAWLVNKLELQNEDDLNMLLDEMDDSELEEAYSLFQAEQQDLDLQQDESMAQVPSMKDNMKASMQTLPNGMLYAKEGAKIEYLKKLQGVR